MSTSKRQQIWELRIKGIDSFFFILAPSTKYSAAAKEAEKFIETKKMEISAANPGDVNCTRCGYSNKYDAHATDGTRPSFRQACKFEPELEIKKLEWRGGLDWPEVTR